MIKGLTRLLWVVLLPVLAAADDDWLIEKVETTRTVASGAGVSVLNLYGDVRCRVIDGDELVLVANVQRHKEDPRHAAVKVAEDGGRWRVEVVYPKLEAADKARLTVEMERRRVDVSVLVPAASPLVLRTADGLIEAKGLKQAVEATSEKGRIFLRTSGTVRAHTDHGELEVWLRATEWAVAPELSTLTGDLTVWLPPQPSARVEAETHGELSTDFSIEVGRREDLKKMAVAVVGEGGGRLALRSEKGRVRIFESRW